MLRAELALVGHLVIRPRVVFPAAEEVIFLAVAVASLAPLNQCGEVDTLAQRIDVGQPLSHRKWVIAQQEFCTSFERVVDSSDHLCLVRSHRGVIRLRRRRRLRDVDPGPASDPSMYLQAR